MSYWQYWELNAAPFAGGGRHQFYRGQSIDEALARIEFVCGQRRRLATLLAGSGVGKTRLLNHLVANPPRHADLPVPHVVSLSMVGLTGGELPQELARRLSGKRIHHVADAWSTLSDYFTTSARSASQTLLLIDDVESSNSQAEQDLIRIVRAAEDAHVSTVLAMESHLASTVSWWLTERSYLQVELSAWDLRQTGDYIRFCLAQCGRASNIFTDTAVARIHELSRGTARRISQLADLALIAGAVAQMKWIDDSVIEQVGYELPKPLSLAA